MKSSASKIQLAGFDDLFQTSSEAEANGEQVREVPLTELFPFKDHPFQVRDDEAMQKTVASIARTMYRVTVKPQFSPASCAIFSRAVNFGTAGSEKKWRSLSWYRSSPVGGRL